MHDDVFSMNMHQLVDTIDIIDSCASRDRIICDLISIIETSIVLRNL